VLHCRLRTPVPPVVLVFNHETHIALAYHMSAQSGNVMNAWLIYWCYSTNIPGPFFKGPIEPLVVQVERYYYYYYYYRKKRFRWRNVKRLQGHLTNAKNSGTISFQRMFWISDMLPFRNYSESKATAVENRGQDSHFSIHPFPPCKN